LLANVHSRAPLSRNRTVFSGKPVKGRPYMGGLMNFNVGPTITQAGEAGIWSEKAGVKTW